MIKENIQKIKEAEATARQKISECEKQARLLIDKAHSDAQESIISSRKKIQDEIKLLHEAAKIEAEKDISQIAQLTRQKKEALKESSRKKLNEAVDLVLEEITGMNKF